jgi:hypothetical protein
VAGFWVRVVALGIDVLLVNVLIAVLDLLEVTDVSRCTCLFSSTSSSRRLRHTLPMHDRLAGTEAVRLIGD